MFGKLVIRWSRTKYHSELDGHRESSAYVVVAQDANSVVVRTLDPITEQLVLLQIFFDGDDSYRVTTWFSGMIEWFKRVK